MFSSHDNEDFFLLLSAVPLKRGYYSKLCKTEEVVLGIKISVSGDLGTPLYWGWGTFFVSEVTELVTCDTFYDSSVTSKIS